MSEKAITQRILKYLRERGYWAEKIHGGLYQRAGLPDIFAFKAIKPGWIRSLAIEVKTPKGRLTPLQSKCLDELKDQGVYTLVARSVNDVREAGI